MPEDVDGGGLSCLGQVLLHEEAHRQGLDARALGDVPAGRHGTEPRLPGVRRGAAPPLPLAADVRREGGVLRPDRVRGRLGRGAHHDTSRANRRRLGDHGRKQFITAATEADFALVFAVTDAAMGIRGGISAFLVERPPGFRCRAHPGNDLAVADAGRARAGRCGGRRRTGPRRGRIRPPGRARRHRREPPEHRGRSTRDRPPSATGGDRVREGACRLRTADRLLPVRAGPPRRLPRRPRAGPAARLRVRSGDRRGHRRAWKRRARQARRDGGRAADRRSRDPDARRRRRS